MKFLFIPLRNFYAKFERPISSISLFGGFVFDAIVLKRVDLFWENFWVVVHLAVVAICIILVNRQENEDMDDQDPAKAHFWYINTLQFVFGGLLSTYLVFYFRSATPSVAWPFLLILALAFIANERLKKHYARLTFQISLFYLSILSFALFIVPVLVHRIGTDIFLLSGLSSLLCLWIFLRALRYFAREKFKKSRFVLLLSIASIFFLTNILYFYNLIPPIPLSLKDGGVYHGISRDVSGNYIVEAEDAGWMKYFTLKPTLHLLPGDFVYAYSAVFSPTFFQTDIIHEWEKYDDATASWLTVNRVNLPIAGGREGGFRTYSVETNIGPGAWRVNVETLTGQVIGRLRFDVIQTYVEPLLKTETKD